MASIGNEFAAMGSLGSISATNIKFSPSGNLLAYLFPPAAGRRNDLHLVDLSESCPTPRSLLVARPELRTQLWSGILRFEWAEKRLPCNRERMLVVAESSLWVVDIEPKLKSISCAMVYEKPVHSPHISPLGSAVAFTQGDDLYLLLLHDDICSSTRSNPVRVTAHGSSVGWRCGVAEYVAEEEMNRKDGYWWSSDGTNILFVIVDESEIPEFNVDEQHTIRYPFAGKSNARTSLAVLHLSDLSVSSVMLEDALDSRFVGPSEGLEFYLARAGWWSDGSIMAQVQSRDQSVLLLLKGSPSTGLCDTVLEETSEMWINLHDLFFCLPLSFRLPNHTCEEGDFLFLWGSERSGSHHLYLYHFCAATKTAACISPKAIDGSKEGVVQRICAVDEASNTVYFMGNHKQCGEIHLFRSSLVPGNDCVVQITPEAGTHNCEILPEMGIIADSYSSIYAPYRLILFEMHNSELKSKALLADSSRLIEQSSQRFLTLRAPVITSVPCADSSFELQCAIYFPAERSNTTWPTIVSIYGGPTIQTVCNCWELTADLRAQRFAEAGFLVVKCDNRGSSRRGVRFESCLKRGLGIVEIDDQIAVVNSLIAAGLVDAERIGIYGWSYGGFLSIKAIQRQPCLFRCAVAGAPVTFWEGYNTHYTERYLGLPQKRVQAYRESGLVSIKKPLECKLLVIHGLKDDNVHVVHSKRIASWFDEDSLQPTIIYLPDAGHTPCTIRDRLFIEDALFAFFATSLRDDNP